jgi:hypothetical protein
MTPFYQHLTGVPGFGAASNVDTIGAIAALGVGAAFAGHGLIQIMKRVGTRAEPIARSNDRNADERRGGPSGPPETKPTSFAAIQNQEDAPPCSTCGSIMIRSGSCYKCTNCGTTSGCA